ncbi:MAG: flagellar brake domain-containing protein [Desulfamplus sp.]|nr:flagellar brake domain-containing protein [Desulfamplus sp.]
MKSFLKPISNMFGKKVDESSVQEEDSSNATEQPSPHSQLDDDGLAKRYCDTFSAVQTVKTKLDKLMEAKEHIAEERFVSLNEQYSVFLDKHNPSLKKLLDEIDRRLESYISDKKNAAEKFTEIKQHIQQEAKLLAAGAISKEEYIDKIQSFKPEEKLYKEKYKTSQDQIVILKNAKNNKYTPPVSADAPDESSAEKVDSKDTSNKTPRINKSEVYTGRNVNINIESGTNLSVKIDSIAIPITANFVGTEKYEYILITHPAPYTTIKPKLFAGNKMYIECLFDGKLFMFSSAIIETLTKPIRAVVLEYPQEVIIKVLRSSSRVICRIPSTLIFKGLGKESIISDINPGGCRIEATYQPTERNYIGRANEIVKIQCTFPGDVEIYTISGLIKNIKKQQLALLYGIQFTEISEPTTKAITKYLSTIKA